MNMFRGWAEIESVHTNFAESTLSEIMRATGEGDFECGSFPGTGYFSRFFFAGSSGCHCFVRPVFPKTPNCPKQHIMSIRNVLILS